MKKVKQYMNIYLPQSLEFIRSSLNSLDVAAEFECARGSFDYDYDDYDYDYDYDDDDDYDDYDYDDYDYDRACTRI